MKNPSRMLGIIIIIVGLIAGTIAEAKSQSNTMVIEVVDQDYYMKYTAVLVANYGIVYTDTLGNSWLEDGAHSMLPTISKFTVNQYGFESIKIYWENISVCDNIYIDFDGTSPEEFEGIAQLIYAAFEER